MGRPAARRYVRTAPGPARYHPANPAAWLSSWPINGQLIILQDDGARVSQGYVGWTDADIELGFGGVMTPSNVLLRWVFPPQIWDVTHAISHGTLSRTDRSAKEQTATFLLQYRTSAAHLNGFRGFRGGVSLRPQGETAYQLLKMILVTSLSFSVLISTMFGASFALHCAAFLHSLSQTVLE